MITPEQIKLSDGHAGVTSSGSPVIYVLSKGGLHMFLTKNGGRVEALAAAPHIGIARFFAEKKAGGIEWSPEYMMKSEELNKAPIIMNQDEEKFPKDVFQETGSIANSYKHKVQKLKSGLYHHIFQDPESVDHPVENDPPQFIHTLSQHADPAKRPLSVIDGLFSHHPEHGSVFRAYKTATAPEHQGKGYGTRLKALATKFHGRMQSDYSLSEPEEQSWQKLARKPNFHFEEAATVFDSEPKGVIREEAENSTHLMTYKPKKLAASELEKGSRQRAMGNPKQFVTPDEGDTMFDWTEGESNRDDIPEASPEAKQRFFQKLHSQTEVRKHPKTGERLFLLHRGVGGSIHNRIPHEFNHTSWTPNYNIAQRFSEKDESVGKKGLVRSAWIPESAIHNFTNNVIGTKQYSNRGGTGDYQHEQEYIIKPLKGHNFIEAKQQPLPPKQLSDAKINARNKVVETNYNPEHRQKAVTDFNRKLRPTQKSESNDFLEIRKSFFNKEIMASEETYAIYNHKEKVIDIMDKEDLISTLKKGDITPYSCFVRRIDVESVPSLIGKK